MTNTGGQAAVSSASVRTELSAILSRGCVSVFLGSLDATARSPAQRAPSGRTVCRGASVGLEDPVIERPESAYVETDSLGLCKCTKIHKYLKGALHIVRFIMKLIL